MAATCEDWDIPYLNLSDITKPAEIAAKLEEMNPKIILCSIEDISNSAIQAELQSLKVSYVAVDECQVCFHSILSKLDSLLAFLSWVDLYFQTAEPFGDVILI